MLNSVSLMGRIAKDIDLRYTASNIPRTSFTLAVQSDFKNKQGERDISWIDCVAWRTTAEFISQYMAKGQQIAINGKIQTREYTDKQGNKRKVTEVLAENAYFADAKRDGAPRSNSTSVSNIPAFEDAEDEDLPF